MVTAGIFIIIRLSVLIELSDELLVLMRLIGSVTLLMCGTIGLVQNDIKRVIAYSTGSQLGYMMMICGLSGYGVGLFHLINHGYFKAVLFLCAGVIIHGLRDEQDMRRMGGLIRVMSMGVYFNVSGYDCFIRFVFF